MRSFNVPFNRNNARSLMLIVLASLAAQRPYSATATQVVTSCGTTCTSNCELGSNLYCGSGENGVALGAGVLFDLKGLSIYCTTVGPDTCNNGVTMTAPGAVVFSSVSAARIVGRWNRGVDCASKPNSRVNGVTFQGYWTDTTFGAAIYSCQTVDGNIINGQPDDISLFEDPTFPIWSRNCIVHNSISSADVIAGNRIDGCGNAVRRASGTSPLAITSNNMNCRDTSPPLSVNLRPCIDLGTTSRPSDVQNNILTGDTRAVVINAPSTGVTYGNNICKFGMKNCSSCVSQGRCVANGTSTSP